MSPRSLFGNRRAIMMTIAVLGSTAIGVTALAKSLRTACPVVAPVFCEPGQEVVYGPEKSIGSCTYTPQYCCGDGNCLDEEKANHLCPVDCSGEGPSCGDGYCTPPETTDSCKKDCPSTCAQTGETVYGSANLGPTSCCKKNDGIKPSTSGGKTGMCTAPQNGSLGTCVAHWWKTCGDGECGEGEDICNCRNDCTCGNGKCEKGKGERKKNCPADCK